MKKDIKKRIVAAGLSMVLASAIFFTSGTQAYAYTETTGTVSTDNVKVRESASTTASQVSSLKNGDKVDIVDEATDASGYVWYKIRVNKSEYGYVRSDLITKAGESSTGTNTSTSTDTSTPLPETQVTATEQKTATITSESVNVRKGAGKGYDSVGKVTKGETVTVTGEATGTDNTTWYQITFGNGKQGFVRGDLLEIGEAAPADNGENAEPVAEEETPEATAEETAETQEQSQSGATVTSEVGDGSYALVYDTEDDGTNTWYLYDYTAENPYRVKVVDLITAAKSSDGIAKLQKTNKSYKTFLIILVVIVAALVLGIILLALKLRDTLYYEDDGDEEEEYDRYSAPRRRARDDDEDDDEPRRPRRASALEERTVRPERDDSSRPSRPMRREAEPEDRPVRPRRTADDHSEDRPIRRSEDRPVRPVRRDEDDIPQERPSRRPEREEAPRRRAKNFIGDDEDFEFEFLDLDDDK